MPVDHHYPHRTIATLSLGAIVALLAGCSDESKVASVTTRSDTSQAVEGTMQELATRFPSFAGYAYETPGSEVIVIGVKGGEGSTEVVAGVVDVLRGKRIVGAQTPIRVRVAPYSYRELESMRDRIETRLFESTRATMLGIDELNYRLTIGVHPDSSRTRIEALLREAGIPADGFAFEDWHPLGVSGSLPRPPG